MHMNPTLFASCLLLADIAFWSCLRLFGFGWKGEAFTGAAGHYRNGGIMLVKEQQRPFTALPIEIKTRILQELPDLTSLRNAARCCSSYHNAYIESRNLLLTAILRQECEGWLDDLFLVAQAKCIAPTLGQDAARGKADAASLLSRYRRGFHRSSVDGGQPFEHFTPLIVMHDGLLAMLRFRQSAIRLSDRMCQEFTSWLSDAGVDRVERPIRPSIEEKARLCSAICRWEVFSVLFSHAWLPSRSQDANDEQKAYCFTVDEASELFFYVFLPWELEGMACVYEFLLEEYGTILKQIAEYVLENKPTQAPYLKWGPTPDWFDRFDIREEADGYESGRKYLAELGVTFFDKVCNAEDRTTRDGIIERCIDYTDWEHGFAGIIIYRIEADHEQSKYPPRTYTANFFARNPSIPQPEKPSQGWFWLREHLGDFELESGTPSDVDVPLFAQTQERRWGYVLWDYWRLEQMGVYDPEAPDVFKPFARETWMNV